MDDNAEATIDFPCPRCGTAAQTRFYGPCPACRDQLVAASGGPAREVEPRRFEPDMNVVPNHVATKE